MYVRIGPSLFASPCFAAHLGVIRDARQAAGVWLLVSLSRPNRKNLRCLKLHAAEIRPFPIDPLLYRFIAIGPDLIESRHSHGRMHEDFDRDPLVNCSPVRSAGLEI